MNAFYSPLRYPGGKNCIFPFVSRFFYENNLLGINYAEPYAGGAGLALRLLFEEYVNKIYINDLDRSIYAFWYCALNDSDRLCAWVESVDVSIDNWVYYKHIQRESDKFDLVSLAESTFFLNRTNVSGVIKGGVIGGLEQKGKYKINARFNKEDLISKIQRISRFKNRIILSNLDGVEFIRRIDRKKRDFFIYLDPPYYKKASDLYMNFYLDKDHKRLAKQIQRVKKRWMISYDNQDFIIKLYPNMKKVLYSLSQCVSNRVGNEIFIFSEKVDFEKSIGCLKSPKLIDDGDFNLSSLFF
ncbi:MULTISPECIES: DNA adenine methylase [Porphyromonas]|uniref:DNA adenine methylase n=1 Tax=Porphyromonas TaxID=836 RepID=UPI00068E3E48|nr:MULTISPECIES: DNA adenine methylase [Porphyromonas]